MLEAAGASQHVSLAKFELVFLQFLPTQRSGSALGTGKVCT